MITDPWAALLALLPPDAAAAIGAATAVGAGLLLGVLAGRLGVTPASRAAVVALYAVAVLVTDLGSGPAVDGTGLLLLVAAGTGAVGGSAVRSALALLLLIAAVVVTPVAGAGALVLLAGMALRGDLGRRLGRPGRGVAAAVAAAGAGGVVLWLARPTEPAALPPAVPAVLTVWTLLVIGILWRRRAWLRPVGAAVTVLLACAWVPGPDTDATLVVGAAVALLSAMAAEDTAAVLARRAFGAAGAVAVVAATVLLTPVASAPVATLMPAEPVVNVEPAAAAPAAVPAVSPPSVSPPADTRPSAPAPAPGPGQVAARPLLLAIPAIGVAGPLEDLVVDPDTRELSAPADPARAGWYAAGVVPGERGPAVLGGHVDSRRGPGVFFRLRSLRPGDLVEVTRSDARTVRFSVIAVHSYPKDTFPSDAVYGSTAGPELRLVTCGGQFDRSARSYDDNVVVDAVLV